MREESWPGRGDDEDFGWRRRGRGGHGGHGGHDRGRSSPGRPPFPPRPPGPPGAPMFGTWFTEPGRRGGMRGRRAERGDVRAAALALLAEEPMDGYQVIPAVGERRDGGKAADAGRRAYQLTDEGRAYAEAHPDELRAPWDVFAGAMGDTTREMRSLIGQVAMAAYQVLSAGTESQATQARQLLTDTRKALYRLLAADADETAAGTGD